MAAFFSNLRNTVIAGFVLAFVVLGIRFGFGGLDVGNAAFWGFVVRWCHIICGVMWIGLLWYFNFVSTPTTPSIPAELRPRAGQAATSHPPRCSGSAGARWARSSSALFWHG